MYSGGTVCRSQKMVGQPDLPGHDGGGSTDAKLGASFRRVHLGSGG